MGKDQRKIRLISRLEKNERKIRTGKGGMKMEKRPRKMLKGIRKMEIL